VLLSQQEAAPPPADQPASDAAARATLPLTLLTRAKLVARWFQQQRGGAAAAAAGDHGAMLRELIGRRGEEPEGGGEALLQAGGWLMSRGIEERERRCKCAYHMNQPTDQTDQHAHAGLAIVDGGNSIQLQYTYFPPSEQYRVQSDVWQKFPTLVKLPADLR
jgi:hypothetical protein